jgi:imidazole glycerol-phosphate synthase subunit HisH
LNAAGIEMRHENLPVVAIVDYGLGNLFSVARACERAGLQARVTSDRCELLSADGVILPGVGAFGDAMRNLRQLDLVSPLRQIAHSDKPLLGVCLGQQLLMTESEEFGVHQGLNIVPGRVVHFGRPRGNNGILKVPQVGWNRIHRPCRSTDDPWQGTPLSGLADATFMYFVHSFYVCPEDPSSTLAISRYGDVEFCSAIRWRNVVAFQFHPERSGYDGISIYETFARDLSARRSNKEQRNAA